MFAERDFSGVCSMLRRDHRHRAGDIFRRQVGLSLVELMVGMTIGLFIVGGASSLFIANLGNSRRILMESQINQNFRSAADLIARDLRRAGYWANSVSGTVATGATNTTTANPYIPVTAGTAQITYSFARDTNNVLDTPEQFGFRLNAGVLEMQTSAGVWQTITSANVVTMTDFSITPVVTSIAAGSICQKQCNKGDISAEGTVCPTVTVRDYTIRLRGSSASGPLFSRELTSNVRVRNDQFAGACPL